MSSCDNCSKVCNQDDEPLIICGNYLHQNCMRCLRTEYRYVYDLTGGGGHNVKLPN